MHWKSRSRSLRNSQTSKRLKLMQLMRFRNRSRGKPLRSQLLTQTLPSRKKRLKSRRKRLQSARSHSMLK